MIGIRKLKKSNPKYKIGEELEKRYLIIESISLLTSLILLLIIWMLCLYFKRFVFIPIIFSVINAILLVCFVRHIMKKNDVKQIVHYHISEGSFWIRIFGVGFAVKDINKHPLIFSERNGYTKIYRLFYPYYLKFLKRSI